MRPLPYRPIVEQGSPSLEPKDDGLTASPSFFTHLISILGPDFVNPVCILLLEPGASPDGGKKKQANKASLAVSIMQSRPIEERLTV